MTGRNAQIPDIARASVVRSSASQNAQHGYKGKLRNTQQPQVVPPCSVASISQFFQGMTSANLKEDRRFNLPYLLQHVFYLCGVHVFVIDYHRIAGLNETKTRQSHRNVDIALFLLKGLSNDSHRVVMLAFRPD